MGENFYDFAQLVRRYSNSLAMSGNLFLYTNPSLPKRGLNAYIPSADEWKKLRIACNAVAHEYPDDPELRTSAVNLFLAGAK